MTTSAASSRFETYTKEQLLYFYGIVNILLIYVYNIATVGWQLVHYTVYGTKKSDNAGLGFASSIIAFLRPVNCIVDSPPSNICIILPPHSSQYYYPTPGYFRIPCGLRPQLRLRNIPHIFGCYFNAILFF